MMMDLGTNLITEIFTQISHHLNTSVIFVTQSLFGVKKEFRTISLNAHYLIIMKNPRDKSQVSYIGQQMMPKSSKFVTNVYNDTTQEPHSYLLFDFHQSQSDSLRLRSSIFYTYKEPTCT